MHILSISNCPLDPMLGSGQTRLAWSQGLRDLGHQVETIDTDAILGPDRDRARGRRGRLAWRTWRMLATRDLGKVDLIEFFGAEFALPTLLLARRPRRRRPLLVAHTDGLECLADERLKNSAAPVPHRLRGAVNGWLNEFAFTRADAFVTGCEADRRFALDHRLLAPEQMAVISLGLEAAFIRAADEAATVNNDSDRAEEVVYFGSWIPRKGTGSLVKVMERLLGERPGLRLTLLGTGSQREPARACFTGAVRDRVSAAGPLPVAEIIAVLKRARVFFFPSEYEGFGLALAEAMACGCAPVTTPTGLGAELRDGEEALICPFGDAATMGSAVERLLDDAPLRARLAAAGRLRARSLRWSESVRRLEEVYEGWLKIGHRSVVP